MNRRGFISLLGGAAGAVLVPWRGTVEPVIFLPPRAKIPMGDFNTAILRYKAYENFSNVAGPPLTEKSLEEMLETIRLNYRPPYHIEHPRLIFSPEIKHLIDTDPVINRAARMALNDEYLPEEVLKS
jgi:hypothetical protein